MKTRMVKALVIDPASNDIRVAMSVDHGTLGFNLSELTGQPASLITVQHVSESAVPQFPTLLDRLGENLPVIIIGPDRAPRYPHVHFRRILQGVTDILHRYWTVETDMLAVIV